PCKGDSASRIHFCPPVSSAHEGTDSTFPSNLPARSLPSHHSPRCLSAHLVAGALLDWNHNCTNVGLRPSCLLELNPSRSIPGCYALARIDSRRRNGGHECKRGDFGREGK